MQQNPQEILSFIDWLGLSLRIHGSIKPLEGYTWQEYTPTNVWGERRQLYTNDGNKVLTLLSAPRSTMLEKSAALLEIENEWLYHGGGPDAILSLLDKSIHYEVLGISRLDLAFDFVPTKKQKDIIEGLAAGKYYVGSKRNGSLFWSTNTSDKLSPMWTGRKIPHCQSWGHKTSAIKWKLYYKTKELLDDGGGKFMTKPYIIDQWRMADFDITNVWRLEVSLKHLNDYNLYGERISLDVLRVSRGEISAAMYLQRFKTYINEGHKDRTNDSEIEFLPIPQIGKAIEKRDAERIAERSGRITLLRHLVSSLEDEHVYLDTPTREGVLEHIAKIVKRDGLQNYFKVMTGEWLDEYVESVNKKAISGGLYDIPNRAKQSDMKPNAGFDDVDSKRQEKRQRRAAAREKRAIDEQLANLEKKMQKPTEDDPTLPDLLP